MEQMHLYGISALVVVKRPIMNGPAYLLFH